MQPRAIVVVLVCAVSAVASGQPLTRDQVPAPLKPWIDWALYGHEQARCPFLLGSSDQRRCQWPASLGLELDDRGGRFEQQWLLLNRGWVPLPGDAKRWPLDVTVDGKPAVVTPVGEQPGLALEAGAHEIAGRFLWSNLPEQLPVPSETGLLDLRLRGKAVPFPHRDEQGRLWLQKRGDEEKRENRLDLVVHRRLVDDIPLLVETRIELEVAGESREELLGRALLDGFVPLALQSPLPARLEPNGRLRVQVRPGTFSVVVTARHDGPAKALTRPETEGPWAEQEIWVFEARPNLRLVDLEGVPGVDPQQTRLPDDWKRLPAFRVEPGATITLQERRRGDSDPVPDQLDLERTLWLDFDGRGYTVRDRLHGNLNQSWRLTMRLPAQLGRVAVDSRDQFITALDGQGRAGVEVRQRHLAAVADSRIDGPARSLPAVGWDHDLQSLQAELRLPPGWRALHVAGADEANPTWVRSWTLLDLFIALLVVLAIGKLWGVAWAAIALFTLAFTYQEPGAPQYIWPALLIGEALVRVLPEGALRRLFKIYRLGALLVLTAIAIPFLIQQVRQGMYPALEQSWQTPHLGFVLSAEKPPAGVISGEDLLEEIPPPPPAEPEALDQKEDKETALGGKGEYEGEPGDLPTQQEVEVKLERSKIAGLTQSSTAVTRSVRRKAPAKQWGYDYDPNTVVQTGPGRPAWEWNTVRLHWSGPVERDQKLRLWLVGPTGNLLLSLIRVLLVAALVLCAFGFPGKFWPRLVRLGQPPRPALWSIPLALLLTTTARAQEPLTQVAPQPPPVELLDQLRQRLLTPPQCLPACAASGRLLLEVTGETLRLRQEIDAAADSAVPLPGNAAQWLPATVGIDGRAATGLARSADGQLWLYLSAGKHQVALEGPLPAREVVQLGLPLRPHRVEARATGWSVDGIHPDGTVDQVLQMTRLQQHEGAAAALEASTLPPFVRVEREISLGLSWQIETRVVRLTPPGTAVVIEVPLLPGESVTSADLRVERGKLLVNMGPQVSELSWNSVLETQPKLELKAPAGVAWTELWRLDASPIWHLEVSGIPTVNQAAEGRREWRPWPGEVVTIATSRPAGVAGQTLTIDGAHQTVRPGSRATDVELKLVLRSSRGGQHVVALPADANLQSVSIDGRPQPVRQEGRQVTLPLLPGAQRIALGWRQPGGIGDRGLRFRPAPVDVGAPAVNVETQIEIPRNRWVLLLQPQQLGPAVLFWSMLVVLLIASIALGLVRWVPLRWYHWFLLGIGLSQVSIWTALVVVVWLLALGWRRTHIIASRHRFNLSQVAIAIWSAVALITLVVAVAQGLLGTPEMQIAGNGSSRDLLRWYVDRAPAQLPQPWAITVSIWWYRAAMLAWAMWLAWVLLRWLRWGFACFSSGGLWRPKTKIIADPAAATAPTAAPETETEQR
ncbi:MAG: hypothetical protein JXR83_08150 [Deltaproteobacteria bacterium]|nr:hypothetical protein [Deltaproteobacteria bacterium]